MTGGDVPGFGELLRRHRVAVGLSQEGLAERAGLSARGVSDLERGARTAPRLETVRMLADALALTPSDRAALLAAARPAKTAPAPPPPRPALALAPPPVPPTRLVEREREVGEVCALLRRAEVRLVSLTGPGGVGKTRLALAVAAELAPHLPDGVAFVDLAPVREPGLVLPAVAGAVGLRETGERPLLDQLRAHLGGRDLLLVLDNCEQVLEAMTLPAVLLAAAPRLKVLATSRERLHLRGEREVPVEPLAVPDPLPAGRPAPPLEGVAGVAAVRLFVERAEEARHRFALTAENAGAVAELCRRLEGLPLALELAAARVRLLSPAALLGRLAPCLPELTDGPRDLPDRQRTLRATIAWSHDLLSAEERALFRRLAVFAGGWPLEAAEAVAGAGAGAVFAGLGSLADKSLVRQAEGPGGEPRFGMLETVREYALERLEESGEAAVVRDAHAAHFLAAAKATERTWFGSELGPLVGRWAQEHGNLRAALDWLERTGAVAEALELATALGFFWFYHAVSEGRVRLERLLARGEPAPTPTRAMALMWAGNVVLKQGDPGRAVALAAEGVAVARASGDKTCLSETLCALGGALRGVGRVAETRPLFEEAWALFREVGLAEHGAHALLNLGLLAADEGDAERARALCAEALRLRLRLNPGGAAIVRHALADLERGWGNLARAATLYRENLEAYRAFGDAAGVADSLVGVVLAAPAGVRPERAIRVFAAAAALREEVGAALHGGLRDAHAAVLANARGALGEAAFAVAWAAGRALPLEEAVDEALRLAGSCTATDGSAAPP